jgi:hypothetical protein
MRYLFTQTETPTTYVMRAQVRETTGYPYLQGNSRALPLRVLPSASRARRAHSPGRLAGKASPAVDSGGTVRGAAGRCLAFPPRPGETVAPCFEVPASAASAARFHGASESQGQAIRAVEPNLELV